MVGLVASQVCEAIRLLRWHFLLANRFGRGAAASGPTFAILGLGRMSAQLRVARQYRSPKR
jgi:hypothetical protein